MELMLASSWGRRHLNYSGDERMATIATVNQGKTSFVKQFLNDHPDGTTKTVNEAWQTAGFEGTISPTVVNKTRVKLTGQRRGKARTVAKGKAAANKPKTVTATPGKTSFVREFLHDNPQANAKAVNKAWTAAGMKGTISHPIISQVRKQLGLTGNLPGKTRNAAKEKAAPNTPGTATPTPAPGKTSFVKEFLNANPQGNTKAVNEAWRAAGFEGAISPTLVNKTRVKMNLTGKLRGSAKTAADGEAAPRMPKTATATPGKTSFLKEFLHDHPQGSFKSVNE